MTHVKLTFPKLDFEVLYTDHMACRLGLEDIHLLVYIEAKGSLEMILYKSAPLSIVGFSQSDQADRYKGLR